MNFLHSFHIEAHLTFANISWGRWTLLSPIIEERPIQMQFIQLPKCIQKTHGEVEWKIGWICCKENWNPCAVFFNQTFFPWSFWTWLLLSGKPATAQDLPLGFEYSQYGMFLLHPKYHMWYSAASHHVDIYKEQPQREEGWTSSLEICHSGWEGPIVKISAKYESDSIAPRT